MNEVGHVCDLDSFLEKIVPLLRSEVVMQLLRFCCIACWKGKIGRELVTSCWPQMQLGKPLCESVQSGTLFHCACAQHDGLIRKL